MHGEITPDNINIVLDAKGHLQLTLNHVFGAPSEPSPDSMYYKAPELFQHQDVSKSSDMWSLGCILYLMLYKSMPFHFEDGNQYDCLVYQVKEVQKFLT